MKVDNKIVLKLEEFEKCHLVCDVDCPLGQIYDYSCALTHFSINKMKELENSNKPADKQTDIQPE